MIWLSVFAVYFIIWWISLLAIIPFNLKTQDEDGKVTLGTVSSSPCGSHILKAMAYTTVVAALLTFFVWFGAWNESLDFQMIRKFITIP